MFAQKCSGQISVFHEDNQSCLQVLKTGKNPTMRHISRAHGICISALHDYCNLERVTIEYQESEGQKADIFTKVFKLVPVWQHVSNLIGMSFAGSKGAKAFNVSAPLPKKPRPVGDDGDDQNVARVANTPRVGEFRVLSK